LYRVRNRLPELPVPRSNPGTLHPRMLIRRNGLAGELPTEPATNLGQDHHATKISGGQCGRHTAAAASDNEHIAGQLHGFTSRSIERQFDTLGS
jgi:hypothetical protein